MVKEIQESNWSKEIVESVEKLSVEDILLRIKEKLQLLRDKDRYFQYDFWSRGVIR